MKNSAMFINRLTSNGYMASFVCAPAPKKTSIELELEDFSSDDIETYFRPCALDPGRRDVCWAAYGFGCDEHELCKCSTIEYYTMTGSRKKNKKLAKERKERGIERIESNFPTGKTSNMEQYHEYLACFFEHMHTLFDFYNYDNGAERHFREYQGKQRAREEIVNGGRKYNRKRRKHRDANRKKRKRNRGKRKRYKRRLRPGEI